MENQQKAAASDEIDLIELLAKFVISVKENLLSVGLAFAVGTGLGLAYYQFVPNVYESKMILLSDILNSSYSDRITESLENLIDEDNYEVLAKRLQITPLEAEKIKKIEIENVSQEGTSKLDESATFVVTVQLSIFYATTSLSTSELNSEKRFTKR
jgi:uncharacterized protein involved in exopolysaccharide biosynthesis